MSTFDGQSWNIRTKKKHTAGDSGDAETAADKPKQRGKLYKNEPELSLWILITGPGVKMQPRQEVDDTIIVIE